MRVAVPFRRKEILGNVNVSTAALALLAGNYLNQTRRGEYKRRGMVTCVRAFVRVVSCFGPR